MVEIRYFICLLRLFSLKNEVKDAEQVERFQDHGYVAQFHQSSLSYIPWYFKDKKVLYHILYHSLQLGFNFCNMVPKTTV